MKKFLSLFLLLVIALATGGDLLAQGGYTGVWTQRSPANSAQFVGDYGFDNGKPQGRVWTPASFDTQRGRMIIMGGSGGGSAAACTGAGSTNGYMNDWWGYTTSTNAWLQFSPTNPAANNTTAPMGRDNHSLTYDWDQDLYWMYGGVCSSGTFLSVTTNFHSIWSYNPDNGEYTRYSYTSGGPDPVSLWARYNPVFKYVGNDTIVFYGGESQSTKSDTWEFNTSTHVWTQINISGAASAPPVRGQIENAFAWDSANGKLIIFGGMANAQSARNDTWAYDPVTNVWANRNPSGSVPVARIQHAMTYDSVNQVVVLYGGQTPTDVKFNDTWIYKYSTNTWTQLSTTGQPPATSHNMLQYDASTQRSIMIEGAPSTGGKSSALWALQLTSSAPLPLQIITTSLPAGQVGVSYSQTLSASGGTAPYTFSVASGTIPAGLTLSSAGVLSGTPTTATTYNFVARVTDAVSTMDDQSLSVTVSAATTLAITTTSLPSGQVASAYSQTITAVGGTAPRTFAVFSGTLPAGLTLSGAGVLSGTPTTATSYNFTVRVTDAVAATDDQPFTVTIAPAAPPSTLPSLVDEKATYTLWGWAWTASDEPTSTTVPNNPSFSVVDPDIHGETEGDDLWTGLKQYQRTNVLGYLHRATGWARYFKDDYRQCVGTTPPYTYCTDRDSYVLDHLYGRGLIDWYQHSGNSAYLTAAENLAIDVETFWNVPGQMTASDGVCNTQACMSYYGPRGGARHLMFVTRLAEVTGTARWVTLRDKLINLWINSPDWDATRGMYFVSQGSTNAELGSGTAYSSGLRIQSSFQLGLLTEAFWKTYQATGNATLRARLVSMAQFILLYGIDPDTQLTAGKFVFNIINNTVDHGGAPHSPAYCTSLVNLLVIGYKLTGNTAMKDRAKYHLNQGTKFAYSTGARLVPDNEVHHFVDTRFDSSSSLFFYDYNKGELQYCYLIFENGGNPTVEGSSDTTPPAAPTNLRRTQ